MARLLGLLFFLTLCLSAYAAPPNAASPGAVDAEFFETKVRPLLGANCFSCHGPAKQQSSLRLDSPGALRKGGDRGEPIVVPGKPDESLLIQAVRHDGDLKMPPKAKLPAE